VNGVPTASGFVIDPSTTPPTVTPLPNALSVARTQHTANLIGQDILVCGGADETGKAHAHCDLLDSTTFAVKSMVALADARRGHSALNLETDLVVIAGGFNDAGQPLPSMEIYTH
jgi:hypothetical protein